MTKRIIIILCLPFLLWGCGGNSGTQESPNDSSAVNKGTSTMPDSSIEKANTISIAISSDKGADLIVKNDCRNCHREREKLIGPGFTDIAKRYGASDIDTLAAKIIKGGSGHWGDASMSPHPSLPLSDAKTIVKFILQYK
ncbi:c-type cytochrome [Mucilaginibacter sp. FT3.2]|uniref:c-type cytochrome n=1 Tax=Mucilaginibacter sp. FT3.2 TaxID=2723090 RepID=UPI00160D0CB4|nr:c-type cytochrome [Mucilaginibacter sp. FT3.2]MBB6234224.1 cytochrome c [Mucilaginibacter sp. FT3.2]